MDPPRKLVDQVGCWLRLYDDCSVDRTWTGPPNFKLLTEPVPPHPEFLDGVATQDVVIDSVSGQRVRIYLRETKSHDKLPILLHFHGGGFCISQADWFMYHQFYSRLTGTARVICVSVYLRLAPENRLPAAIDDAFSGLIWLQSVAKREKNPPECLVSADFNRIFLIGDSTGGNLVHEVAVRAGKHDLTPLRVAGGIEVHPGFVRSRRSKSELENPQSPILSLDMIDKMLILGLPVGSNKDHPITCPMGEAAPSLKDVEVPPLLVCLAEKDLMVDTEMEYCEAMKKAKKEVEVFVSKDMGHAFYLNSVAVETDADTAEQTECLIGKIKEFIDSH
ncbi:probable carboxylesterase 6 [Prosopis cineraria]|uniref:probable carboxylesterase 6 n=1 Tax=Prosopis cineraria TaxID=364024 RepID=UPI00240EEDED|nr:probable carboxylesterase 6 [Prosopis cineraria]